MSEPFILFLAISLSCFSTIFGFEAPLQDFCVADVNSTVRMNGLPCKDPATVTADDFSVSGLHLPGNTSNPFGVALDPVNVDRVPGLNSLGMSAARLDFAPRGVIPPHTHPRATELLIVLEGSMQVGFVSSAPNYVHFTKKLEKGDLFVVPTGLVHYQYNAAPGHTVVMAALNSENPGVNAVPFAVFGAKPELSSDYLARAFLLDKRIVEQLQAVFNKF